MWPVYPRAVPGDASFSFHARAIGQSRVFKTNKCNHGAHDCKGRQYDDRFQSAHFDAPVPGEPPPTPSPAYTPFWLFGHVMEYPHCIGIWLWTAVHCMGFGRFLRAFLINSSVGTDCTVLCAASPAMWPFLVRSGTPHLASLVSSPMSREQCPLTTVGPLDTISGAEVPDVPGALGTICVMPFQSIAAV